LQSDIVVKINNFENKRVTNFSKYNQLKAKKPDIPFGMLFAFTCQRRKTMKTILKTIFILALLTALISGCAIREVESTTSRSSLDSSVIKTISVTNTSGNINISEWNSNYVEYTVTKKAVFPKDADYVDIEVNEGSTFSLKTKYPPFFCNVSVDYDIKIPKTLNVVIENTSGNVYIDGGQTIQDVTVTSGNVQISSARYVKNIESISGNINADINDLTSDACIKSTSGNIDANIASGI
jgi:hypothetical protein